MYFPLYLYYAVGLLNKFYRKQSICIITDVLYNEQLDQKNY
jgi:hypothetical protein